MDVDDLINELEDLCGDLKDNKGSKKPQTYSSSTATSNSYSNNSSQAGNFKNSSTYSSSNQFSSSAQDYFFIQSLNQPKQQQQQYQSNKQDDQQTKYTQNNMNRGGGDIDDLLDILQSEDYDIQKKQSQFQQSSGGRPQDYTQNIQSDQDKTKQIGSLNQTGSQKQNGVLKQTKCLNPYMCSGGLEYANDEYNMKKRICNTLRCSLCNILITKLENYKWEDDVDLLFFRNNFSRKDKLITSKQPNFPFYKQKAISDVTYSAYSCQCRGTSVNKLGTVLDYNMKEWRCTGHTD